MKTKEAFKEKLKNENKGKPKRTKNLINLIKFLVMRLPTEDPDLAQMRNKLEKSKAKLKKSREENDRLQKENERLGPLAAEYEKILAIQRKNEKIKEDERIYWMLSDMISKDSFAELKTNRHLINPTNINDLMIKAAERGRLSIFCYLLDEGADIRSRSSRPYGFHEYEAFGVAISCERIIILEEIYRRCADVQPQVQLMKFISIGVLESLAGHKSLLTLEYLLNRGFKIKQQKHLILRYAAQKNNLPLVKFLIKKGADVNDGSDYWNPSFIQDPLHAACIAGHTEIVRCLLENGAKDSEHCHGVTCLHVAACRSNSEIVALLLKFGSKPNGESIFYGTPLDWALEHKQIENVRLLEQSGWKTKNDLRNKN